MIGFSYQIMKAAIQDRKIFYFVRSVSSLSSSSSLKELKCGLEIHLQLNTTRKLFSNSKTSFHARPNSQVSLFDAAIPGTQPILNPHAAFLALKTAVALECRINRQSSFDRKHYFYADQPAGYQITQYYHPIANDGMLWILKRDGIEDERRGIGIQQIQLEQDTGKSTYPVDSDISYIDLNRTNHPLVEIITKPDITSPEIAGIFLQKLQIMLKYLGVSTCEFESGAMRVDVNVSIRGGNRCEIKNLASISDVTHAIVAEYRRQEKIVDSGGVVDSITLGWDGTNVIRQREKEHASEYRYIPDPELPPLVLSENLIARTKADMPKLPDQLVTDLISQPHSLSLKDTRTLLKWGLIDYYLQCYGLLTDQKIKGKIAANWIVNDILGYLENEENVRVLQSTVSAPRLVELIKLAQERNITKQIAMMIVQFYLENPTDERSPSEVISEYKLETVNNADMVRDVCMHVIDNYPREVGAVVSGKKPKTLNFLIAMALKRGSGRFNPQELEKELRRQLAISES
ncbi:GatB/GatE catalytic domain-containing protein [Dipodascopsis uninucleata]